MKKLLKKAGCPEETSCFVCALFLSGTAYYGTRHSDVHILLAQGKIEAYSVDVEQIDFFGGDLMLLSKLQRSEKGAGGLF